MLFAAATMAMCSLYSAPDTIGTIDTDKINEASGLAISRNIPDRLYHVNDSGDGPNVFMTKADGSDTKKFQIKNFVPLDVEDLSYASCDGLSSAQCLFVADVGDNAFIRPFVTIKIVREQENFPAKVDALKTLQLKYADGPHNVEGFAVHPNGDIFILSKSNVEDDKPVLPATLYRVAADAWRTADDESTLVAQKVGEIDVPWLAASYSGYGQIVTSFDISPDGKSFLVLTYEAVIEFNFDLGNQTLIPTRQMVADRDFRLMRLLDMPQAEAISYQSDGRGFVYDSEFAEDVPNANALISVQCAQ